jgi:hypothetical protein
MNALLDYKRGGFCGLFLAEQVEWMGIASWGLPVDEIRKPDESVSPR